MKTGNSKAALGLATILLCGSMAPAFAQTPVTVPPATMPAADTAAVTAAPVAVPADPASTGAPAVAPVISPAAQMPVAAAPTVVDASVPTNVVPVTVVAPTVQPAMPSAAPSGLGMTGGNSVDASAPLPGMPANTPAVVSQVMTNLQESKNNVSVEDLSKAKDALTRLDLLLQLEKKIGEIKKTQDDRESGGSMGGGGMGGGMMGQIPASALVLPGQTGAPGGAPPVVSPVISSAPASSSGAYEIEQISGTNGNFNAIMTTPEGDRKTVKVGDKLDGRRVEAIGLDSVQLSAAKGSKKGGKTVTIHTDGVLLTPVAR